MALDIYYMTIEEVKELSDEFFLENYPERFLRAKRLKIDTEGYRSLGVGALLYKVLGLTEKDIKIYEHGKPYSKKAGKEFSISHSGDYIVLAVCDRRVGVDIERLRKPTEALMKRIASASEYTWLLENPEERFIRLWTMKEAVSKLLGKGLLMDFKSLEVLPLINGEEIVIDNHRIKGQQHMKEEYCISVCEEI